MKNILQTIHIVCNDIDKIEYCISNCQIKNENSLKNTLLSETIDFYLYQSNNIVSVYSDFFENNFDTKQIAYWFAGAQTYVFLVDYKEDSYFKIELFRNYKFLTPLILTKKNNTIYKQSMFNFNEISSLFEISEENLTVAFASLKEYLHYFSSLFKIPFHSTLSDVFNSSKTKTISFYR